MHSSTVRVNLKRMRTSRAALSVQDVMTREAAFVFPETDVASAAKIMRDRGVGALPVCDGRRLVGIVTDRDIAIRHVAEERGSTQTVANILTPQPYWVRPGDSIDWAEDLMEQQRLRRLPVCEHGELVGIITRTDISRRTSG